MSEGFAAGLVGIVLDERYRLDAVLGEGGMGAVYRAHHLAMDRRVAVKLLKPHLSTDEAALQRFAREARSTMKVESDHAVKVLDFGITPLKDYYMVLEYLDGRTVQRELDVDGPFAPERVIHIAKQTLHALGAAHAAGLVHRDIKPDNLLLMRAGDDADYVKVLDFGVAKLMEGAAQSSRSQLAITQAGMVFGTPEFMSPEQACGQPLDGRSDIYSLAATMFAMLTGCGMYRASSALEWLTHHARTPPPHLAEGLPALAKYVALDTLLQRCLAKRREDRPANAAELMRLLDTVSVAAADAQTSSPISASATLVPLPRQSDAVTSFTQGLSSDLLFAAPTTGTVPVASGRRALWIVLGASIAMTMVIVAIVVAARKRSPRDAAITAKPVAVATPLDAQVEVPADAAAPPIDAPVAVNAAADAAVDTSRPARPKDPPRPAAAASPAQQHIAAAEEAKRTGNRLRQLAEADAALQIDPRNVRARLLFADALIASGDLDRGCKYLRDLGKNPTARDRALKAGCPTD